MTIEKIGGRIRATILGCGSSGGVPRIGGVDGAGDWGACNPDNSKNRRRRCSLLVERVDGADAGNRQSSTTVLIDTSPDMREQLIDARVARLDGVLITHDHADQTHGLDDLRAIAIHQRAQVPVHMDRGTSGGLLTRFAYCFVQPEGSWYPPILKEEVLPMPGETFSIDGPSGPVSATPFVQAHGAVQSLGFRIGDLAYSSDVVDLPEESFDILAGVKVWIVDALQMTPHGSHAHFDKALEWIERVQPAQAILTNLHISMDYDTVCGLCPDGVEPAFDGMTIFAAI